MKLLSSTLVSGDLLKSLREDLGDASICRFMIAYVTGGGLQALGPSLRRCLEHQDSFGVSSLSCSCGFKPLLALSRNLHIANGRPRLKYFMDPMVGDSKSPNISLFHSKLVYLVSGDCSKSIVYIGSHNWTGRGLGPGGVRNAEATLRIEFDFEREHLLGVGASISSQVNAHLIEAFQAPACLDATDSNEATFEEWYQKGCGREKSEPLEESRVVVAVLEDGVRLSPTEWTNLSASGVYAQIQNESDGDALWDAGGSVVIMVWQSVRDLEQSMQPHLLRCRVSTQNAGPSSKRRGTNQSSAPIAGFVAALREPAAGSSRSPLAHLRGGLKVEYFEFTHLTMPMDSGRFDGSFAPTYQFYLEIDQVVFPESGDLPDPCEYVWDRSSFAMVKKKEDAKRERLLGYFLTAEKCHEIRCFLEDRLGVSSHEAKVLPFSERPTPRAGKRLGVHPLHETYLGDVAAKEGDSFYERAKIGHLVPETDPYIIDKYHERARNRSAQDLFSISKEQRAQKVFTMPLDELLEGWRRR